jgi:hypothetical protein
MRKILALILAVGVAVMGLTGCRNKADKTEQSGEHADTVIKIGVFRPDDGSGGQGEKEILGIQFANAILSAVDLNGQTYTIELYYGDDAATAPAASDDAAATTPAVTDEAGALITAGCDVILGSFGADNEAAGRFIAAGLGVIDVSGSGTDGVFSFRAPEAFEGAVMAAYAAGHYGAATAYVLTKNGDDTSQTLGAQFMDAFKAAGGTVVEGSCQDGNTDYADYFKAAPRPARPCCSHRCRSRTRI